VHDVDPIERIRELSGGGVGDVFTLDGVDEALQLVDRKIDGRDAIRVGLRLVDSSGHDV
jgi:hypothetical protein